MVSSTIVASPAASEPSCQLELVVVNSFSETRETRHDERTLLVGQGDENRADAGMSDDHPRVADELDELAEGDVVEAGRASGSDRRRAVLNNELLVLDPPQFSEKAVERSAVRSGSDQDHCD